MPIRHIWMFFFGISAYFALKENKINEYIMLLCFILLFRFCGYLDNTRLEWTVVATILLLVSIDKKIKSYKIRRIIQIGSKYSYSLYLIHPLVLNVIGRQKLLFETTLLFGIVTIISIFILTYIVHNLIENPCVKIGNYVCNKVK